MLKFKEKLQFKEMTCELQLKMINVLKNYKGEFIKKEVNTKMK